MKKLYTIAMAAAVTMTASAITRQQASGDPVKFNRFQATAEQTVTLGGSAVTKAPAKASAFNSIADVEGEYVWSYYQLIKPGGSQSGIVEFTILDEATGLVQIDGLFSSTIGLGSVTATYDVEAGTLTVPNRQYLGIDNWGDPDYFYFKALGEDGFTIDGAIDAESVVVAVEGSTFTFADDIVIAVGDPDNEDLGWWELAALNEFTKYVEPSDTPDLEDWTTFTTATMIDGWIIPALTYNDGSYADPEDFPLTVSVARNNENPNLLLIENPYLQSSGFPLSGTSEGYIVLDITDPDFVLVMPEVYSGFTNGSNRVYCFNIEGYWTSMGYTKEDIVADFEGEIDEWSNMTEEGTNTIISIPTCRFNYPTALDKMYVWTDRGDAMKATITIEGTVGIDNVIVANEDVNAPVEYFTVQGARVDNPQAGSIVIRRQGSQVSKVIVK